MHSLGHQQSLIRLAASPAAAPPRGTEPVLRTVAGPRYSINPFGLQGPASVTYSMECRVQAEHACLAVSAPPAEGFRTIYNSGRTRVVASDQTPTWLMANHGEHVCEPERWRERARSGAKEESPYPSRLLFCPHCTGRRPMFLSPIRSEAWHSWTIVLISGGTDNVSQR